VRDDAVVKEELDAAVAARRELGEEMEPAVIDAFVKRIEKRIGNSEKALKRKQEHQKEMILGSMGISIPLFAIAAIFTGLPGIAAICLVLAVVAIVSSR
jgi:uncharacterized membrane protein